MAGALIAFAGIVGVPLAILVDAQCRFITVCTCLPCSAGDDRYGCHGDGLPLYMSPQDGRRFLATTTGVVLCASSAALAFFAHWHMWRCAGLRRDGCGAVVEARKRAYEK